MAYPTYHPISTGSYITQISLPGTRWSNTADGDVLVFITATPASAGTPDIDSFEGFEHAPGSPFVLGNTRLCVFWMRRGTSAPGDITTTTGTYSPRAVVVSMYIRGLPGSGSPADQVVAYTTGSNAASTTATIPAITTDETNTSLFTVGTHSTSGSNVWTTSDTPYVNANLNNIERHGVVGSFQSGSAISAATWSAEWDESGDTGTGTYTISSSVPTGFIVIALRSDDSVPVADYTIEPDTTAADEGDTVTFDITAPTDDTLDYQITGDITADDIASGTLTGTITITAGVGSLAVELLEDGTLEGAEEFAVELYTDSGLTELVATSATVTVADTSTAKVYSIAHDATPAVVSEGAVVTYTLT